MDDLKIDLQKRLLRNDPEPLLSLATICVGTLAMAGAIANAFINYRKYARDQETRKEDSIAEFRAEFDLFRVSGTRLLGLVNLIAGHGRHAFEMTENLPAIDEVLGQPVIRTLRAGETSVDLDSEEIQDWNALVTSVADTIGEMNKAVQTYEEHFASLVKAARRVEVISRVGLEPLITNVVDHALRFRKALDAFQNLRASSTVEAARRRFELLARATYEMVDAGIGFGQVTLIIVDQR